MNNEHEVIKLEVKNEFLQRENAALNAEIDRLREKLARAERILSAMRVELHVARHAAQDAQKPRQARSAKKFELDDDVKKALQDLATFNQKKRAATEDGKKRRLKNDSGEIFSRVWCQGYSGRGSGRSGGMRRACLCCSCDCRRCSRRLLRFPQWSGHCIERPP